MGRSYIINSKVYTEDEIIENALEQERQGIEPLFAFYDYKAKEPLTPYGWPVWSTMADGCGVAYRRHDGKMIIVTGIQGDFICNWFKKGVNENVR